MESSNNMETVSLQEIKESFKNLLLGQTQPEKRKRGCEICFKLLIFDKQSQSLSEQVVSIILQAMLVPHSEQKLSRQIKICSDCSNNFLSLSDMFVQLEKLRREFNRLRRHLGRMVIEGTLEQNGDSLEEQIESVEHLFPSCIRWTNNGDKRTAINSEYEIIQPDENLIRVSRDDFKLRNMKPVVTLERIKPTNHQPLLADDGEILIKVEPTYEDMEVLTECGEYGPDFSSNEGTESDEGSFADLSNDYLYNPNEGSHRKNKNSISTHPHTCSHCGENFRKSYQASRHVKDVHHLNETRKMGYPCPHCQFGFTHIVYLQRHITIRHPSQCNSVTENMRDYIWITEEAANEENELIAAIEEEMKTKCLITVNLDPTTGLTRKIHRRAICPQCNKKFRRKCTLTRHLQTVHGNERKFCCSECGQKFKRKEHLLSHMQRVHPHVPWSFEEATTNNFTDIMQSEESYSEITQVQPENESNSEMNEIRLEDNLLPSATSNDLNLIHSTSNDAGSTITKEKNKGRKKSLTDEDRTCAECLKVFKDRYYLRRHVESVHTNSRKFDCTECDLKFKRKDHLLGHVKRIHPWSLQQTKPVDETETVVSVAEVGDNLDPIY